MVHSPLFSFCTRSLNTCFGCLVLLSTYSEAEEAHASLAEAATKLGASEACCRELEGKLSLLQKKSENALGEERLKVNTMQRYVRGK